MAFGRQSGIEDSDSGSRVAETTAADNGVHGDLLNDCWRALRIARMAVLSGGLRRLPSQEMNPGPQLRPSMRAEAGRELVQRQLWE